MPIKQAAATEQFALLSVRGVDHTANINLECGLGLRKHRALDDLGNALLAPSFPERNPSRRCMRHNMTPNRLFVSGESHGILKVENLEKFGRRGS